MQEETNWLKWLLHELWMPIITGFVFFTGWLIHKTRRAFVQELAKEVIDQMTTPGKFSGISPLAFAIKSEMIRHGLIETDKPEAE